MGKCPVCKIDVRNIEENPYSICDVCYQNECQECCVSLGNTTLVIMCTVSPDPLIAGYSNKKPKGQKKYLDKAIATAMEDIKKNCDVNGYGIHYELNKALNLHAHILISMPEACQGYNIHCATISKIFHKLIGRPHVSSMVSAHTVWCNGEKYLRYVNKENVFRSQHSCDYRMIV